MLEKLKMREYHRAIFFTKVPLGGYYKYKDIFQIFPGHLENMPNFKYQNHYPNILEFWTTEDEVIEVPTEYEELKELYNLTATTNTKQDKILALLTAFTNHLFFRYTDSTGTWGWPLKQENALEESNDAPSVWCVNVYFFPDMARILHIDSFSEQNILEIKRKEYMKYYTQEPNLDYNSNINIEFPIKIDELFDAYFALDTTTKFYIYTAALYTVCAVELKGNRKTLSLVSSFLAMETMVNIEYNDMKPDICQTCGQPKYSIAKKFREYLLKYIGASDANKKKFNEYYTLRSKIMHTGQHLKTELLWTELPKVKKQEEYIKTVEILQIGKLAITNWLLTRMKTK